MDTASFIPSERWGQDLYGNPCRDCGFSWDVSSAEAVSIVETVCEQFRRALDGCDGTERHPGLAWGPVAYVCHVGDNLRAWAEGLAAGLECQAARPVPVPGYDPDLLAEAKRYDLVTAPAALWSLAGSVAAWCDVVPRAVTKGVVLWHRARGEQRAEDVARNNAHDATHHVWDVHRILTAANAP